jgi:UDP-glucose:(heptosyl)LPS alpha-1,3-glucosyltransferase
VRFLGPRRDLEVVYAAVDGMLLPTRYDAFANVTFEAAAAGLPIVTSRANGAAEWLSSAACRIVDEPGPEGLAAALCDLARPEARQKLGEAARREVAAYHWPGHVAALRAEYRRISASRRERDPQARP